MSTPNQTPVEFPGPVLVVAAHPDDEILGLGAHLRSFREVQILHVTDGAPRSIPQREAYAATRRRELECALALAGVSPNQATCLGAVDQESSFALVTLSRMVAERLPGVGLVFTHPYEGGHPDHDAAAFIVAAATRLYERRGLRAPGVFEFTSYHNGNPSGPAWMKTGEFLPEPAVHPVTLTLSTETQARKRQMLECFASQMEVVNLFPVTEERIRRAPRYDFTLPPHPGRLFYEDQDWGVTGTIWRRLAWNAMRQLGLDPDRNDHLLGPEAKGSSLTADR